MQVFGITTDLVFKIILTIHLGYNLRDSLTAVMATHVCPNDNHLFLQKVTCMSGLRKLQNKFRNTLRTRIDSALQLRGISSSY